MCAIIFAACSILCHSFLLSLWPNLRLVVWTLRSQLVNDQWGVRRARKDVEDELRFIDDLNDLIGDKRLLEGKVD